MVWLPLVLGIVSVLQAGLNRRVGASLGLVPATVLNNIVLLIASLLLLLVNRPNWSLITSARLPAYSFWLPGILGLALVAGIPAAISRMGAVAVFIPLIATQIVASLLWDSWYEQIGWNYLRTLGAAICVAGAVLASWSKGVQ